MAWSYPTGTTVLEVDAGGHLQLILPAGVIHSTYRSSPPRCRRVPPGRYPRRLVGVARPGGSYGLWLATNRGSNPRLLARGETATSISNLVFTANDQLLFVADHGDHKDLHQLDLITEKLVTPATIPSTDCFTAVVASRLAGGGVAWATGPCVGGTVTATAVRNGAFLPLAGTQMARANPVGFLPDGTLVGRGAPGIIAFRDGHVASISSAGTGMVALRVVEPASVPLELPGVPEPELRAPG